MKKVLIFIVSALLLVGCGPLKYSSSSAKFAMGKSAYLSNYMVLQTLNPHFALVVDSRIVANPLVVAIRTAESSDPFYDGQKISGQFVMVDTYTYETASSTAGRRSTKTVPLVVPKKEYQEQISQPASLQRF